MKNENRKHNRALSAMGARMGAVRLEICGNRELVFGGSRGILEYTATDIRINAGKYIVALRGRGLHIKSMNDTDLVIQGFFTAIEYLM